MNASYCFMGSFVAWNSNTDNRSFFTREVITAWQCFALLHHLLAVIPYKWLFLRWICFCKFCSLWYQKYQFVKNSNLNGGTFVPIVALFLCWLWLVWCLHDNVSVVFACTVQGIPYITLTIMVTNKHNIQLL